MKILITGGTGFIGINLIQKLSKLNIEFVSLVRSIPNNDFPYFLFDGNVENLKLYIKNNSFDGVIHLASCFIAEHKSEQIDELINSNLLFSTKVLEAASSSGVRWFLNTGTFWQHYNGEMYNPVNLYAATKQAFEDIAKYYAETTNINFCTIKLNDTYGKGDTRRKIFTLWDEISHNGQELEMSAGEQLIDILHIDDVIQSFLKIIMKIDDDMNHTLKYKSFCLSSCEKISLKNLSEKYEKNNGIKLNIKWGSKPYRKREVMNPLCNGELICCQGSHDGK